MGNKKAAKEIANTIADLVIPPEAEESSEKEKKISLKEERHPAVLAYAKRVSEMSGRDFKDVMENPPTMLINYRKWIYGERA